MGEMGVRDERHHRLSSCNGKLTKFALQSFSLSLDAVCVSCMFRSFFCSILLYVSSMCWSVRNSRRPAVSLFRSMFIVEDNVVEKLVTHSASFNLALDLVEKYVLLDA